MSEAATDLRYTQRRSALLLRDPPTLLRRPGRSKRSLPLVPRPLLTVLAQVPPPDFQGFPTATAPNELAIVALPNNFSAVTTLFDRLPHEVAGHTRSPQFDRISPERSTVGYGEARRIAGIGSALLRIQAIDVARGDFFPPNWTGAHVITPRHRPDHRDLEGTAGRQLVGGGPTRPCDPQATHQ